MNERLQEWRREFQMGDDDSIRSFSRNIEDFNPIHHDTAAARAQGLTGIVAPGVMIMGFVSATIAEHIPGVMVRKIDIKLLNPLYAGSRVRVWCKINSLRGRMAKVDIVVRIDTEDMLLVDGECILLLPALTC